MLITPAFAWPSKAPMSGLPELAGSVLVAAVPVLPAAAPLMMTFVLASSLLSAAVENAPAVLSCGGPRRIVPSGSTRTV